MSNPVLAGRRPRFAAALLHFRGLGRQIGKNPQLTDSLCQNCASVSNSSQPLSLHTNAWPFSGAAALTRGEAVGNLPKTALVCVFAAAPLENRDWERHTKANPETVRKISEIVGINSAGWGHLLSDDGHVVRFVSRFADGKVYP